MARNTDLHLQNQLIYSIYVRSQTEEGTFRALEGDLDRIRALGTDIIWLMPIHPIGVQGKKGSLGCPYANRDYRAVNPEYGTMEDFRHLVDEIHTRGMKCIIDVVYNHTSPDSVLFAEHPEFFYRRPDGRPGNKVGDWTDVIDLDYTNRALWAYQIKSLVMWAGLVDGFRCDVASFVPLEFWLKARAAVEQVRPGCIWLAETVHRSFGNLARREGIYAVRDVDAYEAFDLEYDYDIREAFDRYLRGEAPLSSWLDRLNDQEAVYPENYNKLRCLENHDQPRIRSFIRDEGRLRSFTALLYFLKGTTMLYGGQEFGSDHQPSLFEREPIDRRTGLDLTPLLQTLYAIKQQFGVSDWFEAQADDKNDVAILQRGSADTSFLGIFPLGGRQASVAADLSDGSYENLLGGTVTIENGVLSTATPVILKTAERKGRL